MTAGMKDPKRIGKYTIEGRLGGHMCQVYRARDSKLGRKVAIKVLRAEADGEQRERLLAEARVSSGLRHENLIEVYDFGEEDGCLYLVMELLEGCTLRGAMKREAVGDLDRKLDIARQLASVLHYIHSKKIIHRDVKPDNIFLDESGYVKLMDFGVAKFEGLQLTGAGFTLGTPYYMAPEQVRGEPVTHLVDVYAFGITLFELLAGFRPIGGGTVDEVFDAILRDPIDAAPLRSLGVPEPVVSLIEACTAKDPSARPEALEMRLGSRAG